MTLVVVTPRPYEASGGRVVLIAPAGTDRVTAALSGTSTPVRILARRTEGGGVRLTLQLSTVSPVGAGVELELEAHRGTADLGTATVPGVHFLGVGAFDQPAAVSTPSAAASLQAAKIVSSTSAPVGISAQCLGTGLTATANADHRAVAASTLKAAILVTAMSRDRASPTRDAVFGNYSAAVIQSDNDAANRVLVAVGDGSLSLGAQRVNAVMRGLGMSESYLDGPYRLGGGPSLKRTSARDLERLGDAIFLAAIGQGQLATNGVSRHEARVLIGLMAAETYPGLLRDNVTESVAHKAGWLGAVENDLALVFATPGGTCIVAITTEGLSFSEADAIGHDVAQRVLPLLEKPRPATHTRRALSGAAAAVPSMVPRPKIVWRPIPFPALRKQQMAAYSLRHYGKAAWRLTDPHVIVEHYTANDSFSATWNTFASDAPDSELDSLPGTCAHFVIDTDGTIYQLVNLGIRCRHTVGLNWTAIGIEHVGNSDAAILDNPPQLRSSLMLTLWLMSRFHISLGDVIGHNESLTSPYHHELDPAWRCQTHGDWRPPDMDRYRAMLVQLAAKYHVPLGKRTDRVATTC